MNYLLLILMTLVVFIIFMPLRLKIDIKESKINVNLLFMGLLNFRIDIDKLLNKYIKNKDMKISIDKINILLKTNKMLSNLRISLMRKIVVEKFEVEMLDSFELPVKIVMSKYIYSQVENIFNRCFKKLKYSNFKFGYNEKTNIKILCVFRVYFFLIIYLLLKYIKDIKKNIKFVKEKTKNESPN